MTATYTNTLPTDKDKVRLILADTNTASPLFQDEEIQALLDNEIVATRAKPYFVAASLVDSLAARYTNKGSGISEKRVSRLFIKYGLGSGMSLSSLTDLSNTLRQEGARLAHVQPMPFTAL